MSRRAPGRIIHHPVRTQWKYGPTPTIPLLLRPGEPVPVERINDRSVVKSDLERNNPFNPMIDESVALVVHLAGNYQQRLNARLG
jgi:hypothetical protein